MTKQHNIAKRGTFLSLLYIILKINPPSYINNLQPLCTIFSLPAISFIFCTIRFWSDLQVTEVSVDANGFSFKQWLVHRLSLTHVTCWVITVYLWDNVDLLQVHLWTPVSLKWKKKVGIAALVRYSDDFTTEHIYWRNIAGTLRN